MLFGHHECKLRVNRYGNSCGVSLAVMLTAANVHVSKVFEELVHAGQQVRHRCPFSEVSYLPMGGYYTLETG